MHMRDRPVAGIPEAAFDVGISVHDTVGVFLLCQPGNLGFDGGRQAERIKLSWELVFLRVVEKTFCVIFQDVAEHVRSASVGDGPGRAKILYLSFAPGLAFALTLGLALPVGDGTAGTGRR